MEDPKDKKRFLVYVQQVIWEKIMKNKKNICFML